MPQLTIDVPETLMPLLTRRAEGWRETPEEFIVTYLSEALEHEERQTDQGMASQEQERLEDILEERDKGPFVPIPEDLVERVMAKVRARLQSQSTHA